MDSATWCRTPAAASAARRLRPEVSKNSSTALSSNEGELARSITTCAPAMASLRPSPVMVLTPGLGEAAMQSTRLIADLEVSVHRLQCLRRLVEYGLEALADLRCGDVGHVDLCSPCFRQECRVGHQLLDGVLQDGNAVRRGTGAHCI